MTFEQFLAARKHSNDLAAETNLFYDEGPHTGFIYEGNLVIEDVLENWPEATRKAGRYYLGIANNERVSDDLPMLERELYAYAISEGIVEPT